MSGEFDLIKQYFSRTPAQPSREAQATGVVLGVADDCAIFTASSHKQIATSTDLLIEGRHFFSNVDPFTLGHKALAVNLSDLAAMGARPIGCLLGLALPSIDDPWLKAFSAGFYHLADQMQCPLIGGDTTRSEQGITISVTVFGEVSSPYLVRGGAKPGDIIWVSGCLGEASLALEYLFKLQQGYALDAAEQMVLDATRHALESPQPQIVLGQALHGLAHAVIDISDGLLQDLGHILEQSDVCATVYEEALPISPFVVEMTKAKQRQLVLAGGDVYELCFTAPVSATEKLHALSLQLGVSLTPIGKVQMKKSEVPTPLITVVDEYGQPITVEKQGFDHFASLLDKSDGI